ncbi:MAG: 6,7-dimethyl-8-ribityllumazine synthase [Planctomycetota bacterium]
MNDIQTHEGQLNAEGRSFALVAARYNEIVSSRLIDGALDCLIRHGAVKEDIELFRVPGSFEIPVTAQKLAGSGKFDAVICLGTVIRGETPHFEFVASEAARGVGKAGMDSGVPVVFGVVTTDTVEQAVDRAGGRTGNRGAEAAESAIEMVDLLHRI